MREKTTIARGRPQARSQCRAASRSRRAEMARLFRGHEDALARTLEIAEPAASRSTNSSTNIPTSRCRPARPRRRIWKTSPGRARAGAFPTACPEKVARAHRRANCADRRARLRALFPHRPRHRPLRPLAGHPLPGARLGGQLRRLLLPRHHRGRTRPRSTCCSSASSRPSASEPPDIDVDFEHERREEVIQYIYARYGRDRAGLAATVISYRARSAVREVGKAMGLSEDTVAALAGMVWGTRSRRRAAREARARGGPRSRRSAARHACSSWRTS